ncbi:MAG: hypothetical protein EOO20_20270, partial [Chryseobacterium sp.]
MQDKEFDQLFKDHFEDAEIQPSASLWDNIAVEINQAPKRRILPVWWMAAAVALVVLSVGTLFNRTEKIQLHGKTVSAKTSPATPTEKQEGALVGDNPVSVLPSSVGKNNRLSSVPQMDNKVLLAGEEKSLITVQPNAGLTHPLHMENEILAKVELGTIQEINTTEIVTASNELPAPTVDAVVNENDQSEHTRIRNVGDLINFVVDKVDKREQKFIQFKTDSDDNSSVVAIN